LSCVRVIVARRKMGLPTETEGPNYHVSISQNIIIIKIYSTFHRCSQKLYHCENLPAQGWLIRVRFFYPWADRNPESFFFCNLPTVKPTNQNNGSAQLSKPTFFFYTIFSCPHSLLQTRRVSFVTMGDKACTIRTRKFLTNRLLGRKQFVSCSCPHARSFPGCRLVLLHVMLLPSLYCTL